MLSALRDLFPQLERVIGEERRPRWRLPTPAAAPFLAPASDELVALATAVELLAREGASAEAASLKHLETKVRAAIPSTARARLAVARKPCSSR